MAVDGGGVTAQTKRREGRGGGWRHARADAAGGRVRRRSQPAAAGCTAHDGRSRGRRRGSVCRWRGALHLRACAALTELRLLRERVKERRNVSKGEAVQQPRQQAMRLTAAGHACVAALQSALDAPGTTLRQSDQQENPLWARLPAVGHNGTTGSVLPRRPAA
eukprot:6214141-Pleurochrysis_carterae.AAC.11